MDAFHVFSESSAVTDVTRLFVEKILSFVICVIGPDFPRAVTHLAGVWLNRNPTRQSSRRRPAIFLLFVFISHSFSFLPRGSSQTLCALN